MNKKNEEIVAKLQHGIGRFVERSFEERPTPKAPADEANKGEMVIRPEGPMPNTQKNTPPAPLMAQDATLRDWFAGQAPEVPDWFRIDYPMQYGDIFHAPFPHGGCSHVRESGHCEKCNEWDAAQKAHTNNSREEAKFVQTKRFIDWRWFYADAMLAGRSQDKTTTND